MDRPTKAVIAGVGLAAALVAAGFLDAYRRDRQIADLVAQCEKDRENVERYKLVCEPHVLVQLDSEGPGIQGQIIAAQNNANWAFEHFLLAAVVAFVLLALPYAWCFFLRRVRELRDAIAGK